jgi:glycerophosphoryl diester phosphodiesterase
MSHTTRRALAALLSLILAAAMAGPVIAGGHDHHAKPLVIGHRGAAGYRPEHTLAGYELAARMGADYIEPDLVSTKDHVLVARHENDITATTDVADHPEFAGRKTTKVVDGTTITGWFTEDFTLAELKTLRAKERIPDVRQRNTIYNGRFQVPTFQEVIDLSKRLSRELHRPIGIYPETKHPTYFRKLGLPLEEPLVKTLDHNGLNTRDAKVFVQSFEVGNLKALKRVLKVPLVQLFDTKTKRPADFVESGDPRTYGDLATAAGLREVARYADGAGPSKDYIVPRDATTGHSLPPTSFIKDAHAAGLVVHPYTFRNENQFLPLELRSSANPNDYGNAIAEDEQFFRLGVDGLFTDNTDTAVEARKGL